MRNDLRLSSWSALTGALFAVIPFGAPALELAELPFAVFCEAPNGTTYVGYLSRIDPDETAIYGTVLGQGFAQITPDGKVNLTESFLGSATCNGATVEELRAAGKTRDFPD